MAREANAQVSIEKPNRNQIKLHYLSILLNILEEDRAIDDAVLASGQIKFNGEAIPISRIAKVLPRIEENGTIMEDGTLASKNKKARINLGRVNERARAYGFPYLSLTEKIILDGVISAAENELMESHFRSYFQSLLPGIDAPEDFNRDSFIAELKMLSKQTIIALSELASKQLLSSRSTTVQSILPAIIKNEIAACSARLPSNLRDEKESNINFSPSNFFSNQLQPRLVKILLIGDPDVDRVNFLRRYLYNSIDPPSVPNAIGIEFGKKTVSIGGEKVSLIIWDTAGSQRFLAPISTYYPSIQVVFLMYSITNEQSFQNMVKGIKHIQTYSPNIFIHLIGLDCHLEAQRAVPKKLAESVAAEYGIQFCECSAEQDFNVSKAFDLVARRAIGMKPIHSPNQHLSSPGLVRN
ncbi:MAG: ras-related protein Rab0-like [Gammaproteobacteria bacterium]|nr:ras-related protein Rab0-like [Gammaproteobacteria bacterium]